MKSNFLKTSLSAAIAIFAFTISAHAVLVEVEGYGTFDSSTSANVAMNSAFSFKALIESTTPDLAPPNGIYLGALTMFEITTENFVVDYTSGLVSVFNGTDPNSDSFSASESTNSPNFTNGSLTGGESLVNALFFIQKPGIIADNSLVNALASIDTFGAGRLTLGFSSTPSSGEDRTATGEFRLGKPVPDVGSTFTLAVIGLLGLLGLKRFRRS